MMNTDYPHVVHRLIGESPASRARYLELSRVGESFQLRALVDNEWRILDIHHSHAQAIWNWATNRINSRLAGTRDTRRQDRSRVVEIVGRLASDRRISRLKLRWRARPMERANNRGTLTMRMTDLAV